MLKAEWTETMDAILKGGGKNQTSFYSNSRLTCPRSLYFQRSDAIPHVLGNVQRVHNGTCKQILGQ